MKIIEIEFVNHIKLGTFKLKWDNSIISIVGANGSGKSFLLSSLHPFGNSSRFYKAYPVTPGEIGYKKIVYDVNGVIYETIHEYVPKKQTHACKSYLNRIENGVRTELNPTGNGEFYKDLVKEHLYFTLDTPEIGLISFKSNGITGTASNRRAVLESTVDMTLLNKMKKNVANMVSTTNGVLNAMKSKQIELLNGVTAEELKDKLEYVKQQAAENEAALARESEELTKAQYELEQLNMFSKVSKPTLDEVILIVSNTGYKTFAEFSNYFYNNLTEVNKLEAELKHYIIMLQNVEQYERLKLLKDKLLEKKVKLEAIAVRHKDTLSNRVKEINSESVNKAISIFDSLIKIKEFLETLSAPLSNIGIMKAIEEKNEELTKLEEVVRIFDKATALSDGKEYSVNFADNCNKCELYRKFIKTSDYIKSNKNKYEAAKNNIPIINSDKTILTMTNNRAKDLWNNSDLSILSTDILTNLGLSSFDEFVSKNIDTSVIIEYKTELSDVFQEYMLTISDLEETNLGLSNIQLDNTNMFNKADIETRIKEIKLSLADYRHILSYKNTVPQFEPNVDAIKHLTLDEFHATKKAISDYEYNRQRKQNEISNLLNSQVKRNTDKDSFVRESIKIEYDLKELEKTTAAVQTLIRNKEIILRSRDIIDKNIPILLLKQNLDFIQDVTNTILAENNIPITISILSENSMISIICSVNDIEVPDASCLSAGETCLVSLIMNACILHLTNYGILCLDEIDANLDSNRRKQFNNIIYSIMSRLNIGQICCISHNVASSIDSAAIVNIGNTHYDTLSSTVMYI